MFSYEGSVFGFVNARVGLPSCALEFTAPVVIADSTTSSEFTGQDVTVLNYRHQGLKLSKYRPEEVLVTGHKYIWQDTPTVTHSQDRCF